MRTPAAPLVYEVPVRPWLRELTAASGEPASLSGVPENTIHRLAEHGFTHLWLMGVWRTGPKARRVSGQCHSLRQRHRQLWPDSARQSIGASPYAVSSYTLEPGIGITAELAAFRRQLHRHGIGLLLDFVPNHVGLDHPWVTQQPQLFVPGQPHSAGSFPTRRQNGNWIAHGRDPYFPAWIDVAQLDYRNRSTREAMIAELRGIEAICDGVRCDAAMLLLDRVFRKTWLDHAPAKGQTAAQGDEFWAEAIQGIRALSPRFLFVAEAYWNTGTELQRLGFDFTYHKPVLDLLQAREAETLGQYLLDYAPATLDRSVHFLENHDEPRAASSFPELPRHRAAAVLACCLPGMRLIHHGQLRGARHHVPVQFHRWPAEAGDAAIELLYQRLLRVLRDSAIGRGAWQLLKPISAWPGNQTNANFVIIQWLQARGRFNLAVVNLAPHRSQCYVRPRIEELGSHNWVLQDLIGAEIHLRSGIEMAEHGLYLDLPEWGAQVFEFASKHD